MKLIVGNLFFKPDTLFGAVWISLEADVVELKGKANFASASAEGKISLVSGEASVDYEGNIDADHTFLKRSGTATVGENGFDVNLNNSTNLGVGAKLGPVKLGGSVNLNKLTNGVGKLLNAGAEYLGDQFNKWLK